MGEGVEQEGGRDLEVPLDDVKTKQTSTMIEDPNEGLDSLILVNFG